MSDSAAVSSPEATNVQEPVTPRIWGCVKFFSPKNKYGFISVLTNAEFPQFSGKDIFYHFSAIRVKDIQYKYLETGEYVEFRIARLNDAGNAEKFCAIEITGIQEGKLMCESKNREPVGGVPRYQYPQNGGGGGVVGPPPVQQPHFAPRPRQYENRPPRLSPQQLNVNSARSNQNPNSYAHRAKQSPIISVV